MPFKITNRMLSSCTNIPMDMFIHVLKNTLASSTSTTSTAMNMFCRMLRAVDLVRPNACGSRLKSEFMRTTFDVSMATSVPLPMAMPMCAKAIDGLSFTPSPTNATILPSACSFLMYSALSCGSICPCASVNSNSFATRSTVLDCHLIKQSGTS